MVPVDAVSGMIGSSFDIHGTPAIIISRPRRCVQSFPQSPAVIVMMVIVMMVIMMMATEYENNVHARWEDEDGR